MYVFYIDVKKTYITMYSLHIDSFNLRGSVTEAAFGRARSTRGGGKYQLVACRLPAASRVGDPCGD